MADPERPRAHLTILEEPESPMVPARKPDPAALIIFGITGDLAGRKLLPALYHLRREGILPEYLSILGVGRKEIGAGELISRLAARSEERFRAEGAFDGGVWKSLVSGLEYIQGDYDDPALYDELASRLEAMERGRDTGGNRLFYLAVPPDLFPVIIGRLGARGLVYGGRRAPRPPWSRVIIEKPIGRDLESARKLNDLLAETLREDQIFRIDHYLGKETVQNILVFRFANSIFEPVWNRTYVDHVQITAAETIDVGSRGGFYDRTGVVRDIVQNHLLQVLALSAMESPISFRADDVRDKKVQVFRSIRPIDASAAARETILARYRGYAETDGVAPGSRTPTYAAMRVMIDNWRWQGVPFYLRAGKNLAERVTEVSLYFRRIPFCLFGDEKVCRQIAPNVLTLLIQPDEGIRICFASKVPGEDLSVASVRMEMDYEEAFRRRIGDAYERLLLDALRGDATLFARRDEVENCWRFVTPILESWDSMDAPLPVYEPGSEGPEEADRWIRGQGRRWRKLGI